MLNDLICIITLTSAYKIISYPNMNWDVLPQIVVLLVLIKPILEKLFGIKH